jgi:branched-chain amino acid transport system ATP-binding protein
MEAVEVTLLQVEKLTRHFGGLRAVEGVSIDVAEHDFLGIIGPNGAGKTTLFSMIAGQLPPTSGRIVFDGKDITGWSAHRVAQAGLVRTFQLMRPFGSMTVLDNVAIASHTHHRSRNAARGHALEVLRRVRLDDMARQGTGNLTTAGLKRLELARALATEPRALLLDEVLAGLVPAERQPMIELLRELHADGLTVLYVEHIMAAVMALSQRLLVMHEGRRLALGDPQEVVKDPRVVEAYLGEEYAA